MVQSLPLDRMDIVGFSLMFEQTPASIALAQRLRKLRPNLTILMGGAGCDGEMGPALLEAYDFIDYTVSGDADHSIVELVRAIREGKSLESIPGLARRVDGRVEANPARPTTDLDALPIPDFQEFFDELRRSPFRKTVKTPIVPFETSRGCWWGQKTLCTFCGLNGTGVGFRRKSQERATEELLTLIETYRTTNLMAADNALDMRSFKGFLPAVAALRAKEGLDLSLFYEVKSNLRKDQIKLLADAGVRSVQPGIESFSDHILRRMDKGATGLQQVQFLRWCEEFGIRPLYNILVYNPGETVEDYEEMTDMLPFISHLLPPASAPLQMMLQRFSPYFLNPGRFGIRDVRPQPVLAYTYGLPEPLLARMVYNFEYDHDDKQNESLRKAAQRFINGVIAWRRSYRPCTLVYQRGRGFVKILDARNDKKRIVTLTGRQADIFLACDAHRGVRMLQNQFPDLAEADLQSFLDELVLARLLLRDRNGRYQALPIHTRVSELFL